MGCSSCGSRSSQASTEPYEIKLPDGSRVTVSNKAQERAERDKYFVRERARARQSGFTVTR